MRKIAIGSKMFNVSGVVAAKIDQQDRAIERLRTALAEIASGLSVRHPFDIANEALKQ